MGKRREKKSVAESDHASANLTSATYCDELFRALSGKVRNLERNQAPTCCAYSQKGERKFAHIIHKKKHLNVTVWLIGNDELIEKFPSLRITRRPKKTENGWGIFSHEFYLKDISQVEAASDALASARDLSGKKPVAPRKLILFPDEVKSSDLLWEGATKKVLVNSYERNADARRKCIEHYGAKCWICNLDFAVAYGPSLEGFIHVHHMRSLAEIGEEYSVDPIKDLRPVCPNCHAVIHHQFPPLKVEDVRTLFQKYSGI